MNREETIAKYREEVKQYFREADIEHSDSTVESIVDASYHAKEGLRKLFNGEDVLYAGKSKPVLEISYYDLLNSDNVFVSNLEEKQRMLMHLFAMSRNNRTIAKANESRINSIKEDLERIGNQKVANRLEQLISPNAKLSKLIAKLIQEESVNITYSKKLQQAKGLEVHVGIRPTDFFSMSDGNSWSSCHSMKHGGGCFQAGPLSLANDAYTVIAWAGEAHRKEWRQQFFIDPTQKLIVGARSYPHENDEATEHVKKFLKQFVFDEEDEIIIARNSNVRKYIESHHSNLFYNDVAEGSTSGSFAIYVKENVPSAIELGNWAYCPACGGELDDAENMYCCRGNHRHHCVECGDGVHEDEEYWMWDETYCDYCYHDRFFYCESCGESYEHDDAADDHRTLCNDCSEQYFEKDSYHKEFMEKYILAKFDINGNEVILSQRDVLSNDAFEPLKYLVINRDELAGAGNQRRMWPRFTWSKHIPEIEGQRHPDSALRNQGVADYTDIELELTNEQKEQILEVL